MNLELYTLLKVKSRGHLGLVEWIWLKLHKKPTHVDYTKMLSDLRYSKCIAEEEWEVDEQGREVIPGLAYKRFYLTSVGKKRLRKLKWLYQWEQIGKAVWCLIWLLRKLWWLIIVAVVGKLVDLWFPSLLQDVRTLLQL